VGYCAFSTIDRPAKLNEHRRLNAHLAPFGLENLSAMRHARWIGWTTLAIALALVSTPAFAQGASTSSSLSGVVTDNDGGVVPGAAVVAKNIATSATNQTVTNSSGAYSFPALDVGTYTLTITLQGFKTVLLNEIRLLAAQPRTVNAKLELGTLSETVEVKGGGTELVRTETPVVNQTVSTEFIQNLPRADRNVLNFLVFLPGVETSGANARGSTISGLPQNTINITIDGVSTSNNLQSGDGFFSLITPRQDAVEEVTLTTATAGADSSGQGATQVRFVTRSGTNQYQTSVYNYLQHKNLNTNTFFNQLARLPRPQRTIEVYGGRIGGPIVIPRLVDGRGKAFFFFNHEESYTPLEARRTRTVVNELAQAGVFSYNLTSPRTVNILELAALNGQVSTVDPTVGALLAQIRTAVTNCGATCSLTSVSTDPNRQTFDFLNPAKVVRHNPTGRVDINVTNRNRVTGSYYWQTFSDDPDTLNNADPVFPGFPTKGITKSFRTTGSIALRSTFSSNLVNEARGGWQWTPQDFFGNARPEHFENQGFLSLGFGFGVNSVTAGGANGPSARNTINWNIDDTVNWLRGSHNFGFGASFTRIDDTGENWNTVPTATFGLNTTLDPAAGIFTTTNFPTATTGNLSDARALYALLTGRITNIGATGRLNEAGDEFIYNGRLKRREHMDEYGFFVQDTWRWKPNLTLTLGLRYELQMPIVPSNGTFTMSTLEDLCGPSGLGDGRFGGRQCNLFNPGVLNNPGVVPQYVFYDPEKPGYATDKNNFAPNLGASWRPNVQDGWLRTLLGDPDQATVSGGYTRSFNRERMDRFINVFGGNPGSTVPATRSTTATTFPIVPPGESWPLLLRECVGVANTRCGPPNFQRTPSFPIIASFAAGNDISIFAPDLQVGYTDSWSVGLQRALTRDMVVEARYVGNVNRQPWATENWNNENIIENNFFDEFRVAMNNLQANVAAGLGGTFAFTGAPGTQALPIYLAHFQGLPFSSSGNPANYTSTNFTNSTFVNDLDPFGPDPYGAAASIWSSGTFRTNMATAGLAPNFWVMNPLVDNANVTRNLDRTSNYHSLILNLRRRLSRGLTVEGSYTYARRYAYSIPNADFHNDFLKVQVNNVPHALKMLWVYQVPVGRGKRFGANWNKWIDGALGGWEFSGAGRAQIPTFRLTNTVIVGMSFDEAQSLFHGVRFANDPTTGALQVFNMPQDVIDNTRLAFDTDPTQPGFYGPGLEPTGRFFAPATCAALPMKSGDCAPDLLFNGDWFVEFDFRFVKKFPIMRKATFEFAAELFNALGAINFNKSFTLTGGNAFRSTSQASGARIGQLVWRVTW
jgi:hypothetical protein